MKKSNALLVWPALFLIFVVCPCLAFLRFDEIGYTAGFIGLIVIIFAMATGRLKLLG